MLRGNRVAPANALQTSLDTPTGLYKDGFRNLYIADQGNHRVATFAIDGVGDVQANGIDHVVVVSLLDYRVKRDAAVDSTRARVRHVSGPGSVKALDTHLSGGQLRLSVDAEHSGDLVFEIAGDGLGDPVVLELSARSGSHLDLNPLQGDQRSTDQPVEVGRQVSVDIYADESLLSTRGVHYKVTYDDTALRFLRIEETDAYSGAEAIVEVSDGVVDVSTVFLESEVARDSYWVGRVVFLAISESGGSTIRLEEAAIGASSGQIISLLVGEKSRATFTIDRPLRFERLAELLGVSLDDPRFDARYDLDRDGAIGFSDFLLFATRRSQ